MILTYTGRKKILCDEPVIHEGNIVSVLTDALSVDEEEKRYCVYCHTSPSGKKYIGVTCQKPEYRWLSDGSGYKGQPVMWLAIQKYGFENFKHEILEDGLTEAEAKAREIALIAESRTMERELGYNRTTGGDGVHGHKKTPEQIERHRQRMIGRHVSEETRAKLREARRGYAIPQYVLDAAHAANRGRKQSPEEIERRRAKLIGRKMNDEWREALSKRMTGAGNHMYGKSQSPETVAKRVDSMADYKHTAETREKIGAALVGNTNPKKRTGRTYNQKSVLCMSLSGALIKAYESATDAARKNGFSQPGISRCCTGERKTYKGFVWKYAQEVSDGTGT